MYKILIWGTGAMARQVLHNGINGEIIGFLETNKSVDYYQDIPVYGIKEFPDGYDYIIVANKRTNEIYQTCLENKIDLEKVIFIFGIKKRVGFLQLDTIKEILGEKNFVNYNSEFGLIKESFWQGDIKVYSQKNRRQNFAVQEKYNWPIIADKYAMAGEIHNYFWQDLWAARLIYKSGVQHHFDIGSRVDGFIAHLLSFDIDVTVIDIRDFPWTVEKLHTIIDDATYLTQIPDESIESMSALCSLEHFGLGRYGDPIDPEACFKCFEKIQQKMKKGGNLYLSLPIGYERVEFNAHRVFYANTIIECFHDMRLVEFSCTADGKIEYHVEPDKYDSDGHNGDFRYGLFHFVKK